jgi:hypothetical protein
VSGDAFWPGFYGQFEENLGVFDLGIPYGLRHKQEVKMLKEMRRLLGCFSKLIIDDNCMLARVVRNCHIYQITIGISSSNKNKYPGLAKFISLKSKHYTQNWVPL